MSSIRYQVSLVFRYQGYLTGLMMRVPMKFRVLGLQHEHQIQLSRDEDMEARIRSQPQYGWPRRHSNPCYPGRHPRAQV